MNVQCRAGFVRRWIANHETRQLIGKHEREILSRVLKRSFHRSCSTGNCRCRGSGHDGNKTELCNTSNILPVRSVVSSVEIVSSEMLHGRRRNGADLISRNGRIGILRHGRNGTRQTSRHAQQSPNLPPRIRSLILRLFFLYCFHFFPCLHSEFTAPLLSLVL